MGSLGPYFAVERHGPNDAPSRPWRSLADFVDDRDAWRARVEATRLALSAAGGVELEQVELRVAASTAHLGVVARLVAVTLGEDVVVGSALRRSLSDIWWRDEVGGPMPMSWPRTAADLVPPGPASSGPLELVDHVLAPLTAALAGGVSVSPRVLWGNIASAAASAAAMAGAARPALADGARRWVGELFEHARLAGESVPLRRRFTRSSCCLIYRLAPGSRAVCADCVLRATRERATTDVGQRTASSHTPSS